VTATSDCEFHVGDVGVDFEIEIPDCSDGAPAGARLDLTGATTLEMFFRRPDGTAFTRVALVIGLPASGVIGYTTIVGDLDQSGTWRLQGHVVISSLDIKTAVGEFPVRDNVL
jgi:hypothetical protein